MSARDQRIQAAITAESESAHIDFKERFDTKSSGDWCEIVKDIVAMANSGGGCLVFGLQDDGTPSDWDPQPVLDLDPATVTDKIFKYTARNVADFEVVARRRRGSPVAVLAVDEVQVPLVFAKPGTYSVGGPRPKTAFAQGTVYFRHGAKSEPATTDDLADLLGRRLKDERDRLLRNLRTVIQAPPDSGVVLVSNTSDVETDTLTANVRLTDNPDAPEFRHVNPDVAYPFRQKEVIEEVNRRLLGRIRINSHDILCVRRAHAIDARKPEFVEHRRFGSPQYTQRFVLWIIEQYERNPRFFKDARSTYRKVSSGA